MLQLGKQVCQRCCAVVLSLIQSIFGDSHMRPTPKWLFALALAVAGLVIAVALLWQRPTPPTESTPVFAATSDASAPIGEYECNGDENGMVVGVGWFDIKADGSIADLAYYTNGTWQFDDATQTFVFTGDLDVAQAVYDPAQHTAIFTLKPAATRAHVNGTTFLCTHKP